MSWRIGYWRGSVRIRTTTLEAATQDEAASYLRILAANQLDLGHLRASEADTPENPEIRSNREGTKLRTTGKDFHYTAEWFLDDASLKRNQ
jgi:hypothetical protein